ncbi:HD domain-containing protein [Thermodesulfobacteriota bacterium]
MTLFDTNTDHSDDGVICDADNAGKSSCVKQVKAIAEKMFDKSAGSHDWTHTLRVHRLSLRIGAFEHVDMEVLQIAVFLHDIGRSLQDASNGAVCHAEKGAQIAHDIIKDLPLSETQKKNIVHCVQTHRFRGENTPKTMEAKILFDADKLDSIGAVGVGRAFLFAGEVGAGLYNPDVNIEDTRSYSKDDTGFREYQVKLNKIKDRIMTQEGKRLANARHDFMDFFFKQFVEEYQGKR